MEVPFTGENPLHDTENWRKRFLPHYDASGKYQSITFRLGDALPLKVQNRLDQAENDLDKIIKTEAELDRGHGVCLFKNDDLAQLMKDILLHFNEKRYLFSAWVIMPNHIHVLVKTFEGFTLSKIVHSWKSYSSLKISEKCTELGYDCIKPVWQREYWDRFIRDSSHYEKVISYIHNNPVKAGLVKNAEDYKWSSLYMKES